ncbi:hypothetical protein PGTUg99_019830 [Puccinia graminis f. sp. tritici]|uniref:Uncharacterized protein n=2 Tax=Puccinia graminis f. sp. tritici TaxID=56615 RepID=A0A5B0SCB0_PUCGR|nr:hypothetical protein PGTUg99_019830 [Puccinia graminis f. sp. tritici]
MADSMNPKPVALSFEPIREPLKVLLAPQNIGQISSLQVDVLFGARRLSHPLSFTQVTKDLTVNLIRDVMGHLSKEIPLLFNSQWQKFLTKKLATVIDMSKYTASIAASAKDEEARHHVGKMPVTIDMSQSDQQLVIDSQDKIANQLFKVLLHHGRLP